MRKKIKILFVISLLFASFIFLFPKPVEAFIGTGVFDYFETVLEGIEEKAGPIAAKIIIVFFTAFIGIILLLTSATLLQWVIENPQWLTLKNPVVESGLYFTTGIVNLFIILFFVAIAIAWILKIETFAAKKALPKLIIVALLVNFVRLFVAIPIDIATIIHRTILDAAGRDFFWRAIEAIYGGLWNMLLGLGAWIASLAALFMIPFVSPFAQYGLVIFVVVMIILFGPVLLGWIAQIVLAYLLSMIFFSLAFLFACRIYIIWFLTIFAPLAFLCMVLPQTQRWWNEWLHHLFSWVFFGIIVLLFLVIGLRGAQYLRPGGLQPQVPGMYWFSLPGYFGYYFFLFVFLSVTSWLSKKMAPEMADFLITQGKAFGGTFMSAARPVTREIKDTARRLAAQEEAKQREWREKAEEAEKAGRPPPPKPPPTVGAPLAWAYRKLGIPIEAATRKEIERKQAEFEKAGYTADEIARLASRLDDLGKAAAALRIAALEGEKGLRKLKDTDFAAATRAIYTYGTSEQIKAFRKFARPRIEEDAKLQEWVNARDVKAEDVARLIRERVRVEVRPGEFRSAQDLWRGTAEQRAMVIREAARRNAIESLKVEDYEKILPETAERFRQSIVRYGRERRGIGRMLEKGILDWGRIEAEIERLGRREVAKTNAPIVVFPYTPIGRAIGARTPRDERGREIRQREMERIISEVRGRVLDWERAREIAREVPIAPPPPAPRRRWPPRPSGRPPAP